MLNRLEVVVDSKSEVDGGFDEVRRDANKLADDLGKTGQKAGEKLSVGIIRGADDKLRSANVSQFAQAGGRIGTAIGDGTSKSLLSSVPNLVPILGGIGLAAAPIIGAGVSAGLIGGVGIGGVIGAVSILKDDARVAAAGTRLADRLLGELRNAARPAITPLLESMDLIDEHINGWGELLYGVFENSTRNLDGFLNPVLDGVLNLTEAFAELTDDALDPVMDALGLGGQEVLDAFADGLRLLSDNGDEAADALKLIFWTTARVVEATFGLVDALTEAYRWMRIISALGAGDVATAMRLVAENEIDATEASHDLASGFKLTTDAAEELTQQQQELNEAIFAAAELNISAADAQLNYTDQLKETTKAADRFNKVSADEEKQLLQLARSSNALIEKLDEQGVSTSDLGKKTKSARDDFVKAATQMGYTRKEAQRLADAYLAIPRRVHTTVSASGIGSVSSAIGRALQGKAAGGPVAADQPIGHAAEGGSRGGITRVGEMGEELIRLPYGSSVMPHANSRIFAQQAMGTDSGWGATQVAITSKSGDPWKEFIDAMIPHLQVHVQRRGQGRPEYLAGG